jgi:hypothetical protein
LPTSSTSMQQRFKRRVRRLGNRSKLLLRLPTAPWRAEPDFIIIGVHKCGTTSLYAELSDHPQVIPALFKEIHYFESRWRTKLGFNVYRAHFPLRHELDGPIRKVTGEATPGYIYSRVAAQRIKRRLPDCRLILILRDPTARAMSHYHHLRRLGRESRSMGEAMDAGLGADRGDVSNPDVGAVDTWIDRTRYVERGLYARFLEPWYEHFASDQILVIALDDLITDAAPTMRTVCDFIGIDPPRTDRPFPKENVSQTKEIDPTIPPRLDEYYREPNRELAALLRQHQPARPMPPWLVGM